MNTANSKTKHSNKFVYNFIDKLNLKNPNKNIALANLSIYYTWKNIKSDYNNNKFQISAPTWNDTFDVPDGSYSIAVLQNYFEYIIKKHETIAGISPVLIYANEINNRIVFKIKSGYKSELLSKKTMKLLGSTTNSIDKDKNSELVPKLESVDLVTSSYALKTNLAALKTEVDNINTNKLKTVPDDLAKLSNVVKNDVVKKSEYNTLKTKVDAINTSGFVTRTKFTTDTNVLDDKIDEVENKIPDISGLATKSSITCLIIEQEN